MGIVSRAERQMSLEGKDIRGWGREDLRLFGNWKRWVI
jgi:hypothetical protein